MLFRRYSRFAHPQLVDRPGHSWPTGRQKDPAEDAQKTYIATASVRENRRAVVCGERVRLRGQERVASVRPGRVDRVQRGPLAARYTGRAGRHVQLSGVEDLHAIVCQAAATAIQKRQCRRAVR